MAKYLAQVVREAREHAGRKPFHIAAAQPGERSLDPSTVYRFEHEQRWPRNPDLLINLYAADLDIAPIELWARALELWQADELSGEAGQPGVVVDGAAARLTAGSASPPPTAPARQRSRRAARPRKSA